MPTAPLCCIIATVLFTGAGCGLPAKYPSPNVFRDPLKSGRGGPTDRNYFEMRADIRRTFVNYTNNVSFGAKFNDIVQLLGIPDEDFDASVAEVFPGKHRRRYICYDVVQHQYGVSSPKIDADVTLWFDIDNRLESITESNVPEVKSRSSN